MLEPLRNLQGLVNQTLLTFSLPFPKDFWEPHTSKECNTPSMKGYTRLSFEDGTYLEVPTTQYNCWKKYQGTIDKINFNARV